MTEMPDNLYAIPDSDYSRWLEEYTEYLTEEESTTADILCGVEILDNLPEDFFTVHTLEDINTWFGAHDDRRVTEALLRYLRVFKLYNDEMLAEVEENTGRRYEREISLTRNCLRK